MESYLWPDIQPDENPMAAITNGADVDTYLARSWVALFEMYMGGGWRAQLTQVQFWETFISNIPDHVFRSVRQLLKAAALEEIRRRASIQYERCAQTKSLQKHLTRNLTSNNIDTLLIGFARRFAVYKQAGLVFRDLERLARLVNDPERPLTLVFAGKAHPSDRPGQALLRRVYEISLLPEFQGRVILLEDYNLSMARDLLLRCRCLAEHTEIPDGGLWHLGHEGRHQWCAQSQRGGWLVGRGLQRRQWLGQSHRTRSSMTTPAKNSRPRS